MKSLETPPSSLDGLMSLEVYQKARSYSLDKNTYTNYSDLYSTVINTVCQRTNFLCIKMDSYNYRITVRLLINFLQIFQLFILTFAFHYFWQWGVRLIESIGISSDSEILASAGCMFVMNVVTAVTDLPFKVYNIFVLEQKHGFNKQVKKIVKT